MRARGRQHRGYTCGRTADAALERLHLVNSNVSSDFWTVHWERGWGQERTYTRLQLSSKSIEQNAWWVLSP